MSDTEIMNEDNSNGKDLHWQHLSPASATVRRALMNGKMGDILTSEEMSRLVDDVIYDTTSPEFWRFRQQIEYCAKHGVVWQWVREERVLKCINDEERHYACVEGMKRVRRKLKRTDLRRKATDVNKLPPELRPQHNAYGAVLGAMLQFSQPSTPKQLAARGVQQQPPARKLLEMFTDKAKGEGEEKK